MQTTTAKGEWQGGGRSEGGDLLLNRLSTLQGANQVQVQLVVHNGSAAQAEKTNFQKLFSSHNDKRPSFYFDFATAPLPSFSLSLSLFLCGLWYSLYSAAFSDMKLCLWPARPLPSRCHLNCTSTIHKLQLPQRLLYLLYPVMGPQECDRCVGEVGCGERESRHQGRTASK